MTRLTRGDEVAIASISAREPTFRSDRGAAHVVAVQHAEVWSSITSWDRKTGVTGGGCGCPDSDVCSALEKRRRGLGSYSRMKPVLIVLF
jgi:hypothetical protein